MSLWNENTVYHKPTLVFGSDNNLYKCLEENGPGTTTGVRDPIDSKTIMPNISVWSSGVMPSSRDWRAIAYGNGKYVAVSTSSTKIYATSDDGINWVQGNLPLAANWTALTFANGIFIAFSSSGMARSADGINWTSKTGNFVADELIYGNGRLVAVASSSNRLASYDENCTSVVVAPNISRISSVAYTDSIAGGMFVGVPSMSETKAVYSSDSITWNKTDFLPAPSGGASRVAGGNGIFVAIHSGATTMYYSTDGINWSNAPTPQLALYSEVRFGGGKFILIGSNIPQCAISEDGITWTVEPMPIMGLRAAACYGDDKFALVGRQAVNNKASTCQINDYLVPEPAWEAVENWPIGSVIKTTSTRTPMGYIELDGTVKSREVFPRLFDFAAASGNIVDDNNWSVGCFSYGDGLTTFRIPQTSLSGIGREVMRAY